MSLKLKDIGEFGFIDRIAPLGSIRSEGVVKGIGDDCAVIDIGGPDYLLVTTDLFVEKVHFLMEWASPDVIGAKVLATNLSDIAACGGIPRDAFISIAVPTHVELDWLDHFYKGMSDLARSFSVNLLGGDTTSSKGDFVVNIALTGFVPKSQVLFRHTARPGDLIAITGSTGASAAGTEILLQQSKIPDNIAEPLIRAHLKPRAHVFEGRILAESTACTAAIDVSDGLSSDLGHICKQSGVGAVLYEPNLPIDNDLIAASQLLAKDPLKWVLDGGEDYVLIVGIKREMFNVVYEQICNSGGRLYKIGKFIPERRMELIKSDGSRQDLNPDGWNHFR